MTGGQDFYSGQLRSLFPSMHLTLLFSTPTGWITLKFSVAFSFGEMLLEPQRPVI